MASTGERILLRELQSGVVHVGRELHGTVNGGHLKNIFYCDRAQTVSPAATWELMDAEGMTAIVGVLHVAREGVVGIVPHAKQLEMFPVGAQVIIKDPIVGSEGIHRIVVELPAMITMVSYFPRELVALLESMPVCEIRNRGNAEFRRGRTIAALEYYKLAINKATSEMREESVLAYSNEAACHLEMGNFEPAFLSCKMALGLEPDRIKTLFRMGESYIGLQEYTLACEVLARALDLDPGDGRLSATLEQAKTLQRQSISGDYSKILDKWFGGGCKVPPQCSDFVGSLEIGWTSDGRGRGLFATEDISAGSLVLVSNAASFERYVQDMRVLPAVVSKVYMDCIKSRHVLQQVYSLAETHRFKGVPPMHLFGPNRSSRGGRVELMNDDDKLSEYRPDVEVDIDRIEDIVHLCGFSKYRDDDKYLYTALWLLPAFINNSCIPNLSKLDVDTTVFFHANRNIKAGEELTMCYWDMHRSWWRRHFESWECRCKRCRVEEALDYKLKDLAHEYESCLVKGKARGLANLAPRVERAISGTSDEEQAFVRTSFAAAYTEYHRLKLPAGEVASAEQVIQDLRYCAPGSYKTIEYIDTLSKSLGIRKTDLEDYSKWIGLTNASPKITKAISKLKDPHSRF